MNRVAVTQRYVKLPIAFTFLGLPWLLLSAAADFMERRCENFADRHDRNVKAERARLTEQAKALSSDERFEEIEEKVRRYREALLAKDTQAMVALGKQLDELKGL